LNTFKAPRKAHRRRALESYLSDGTLRRLGVGKQGPPCINAALTKPLLLLRKTTSLPGSMYAHSATPAMFRQLGEACHVQCFIGLAPANGHLPASAMHITVTWVSQHNGSPPGMTATEPPLASILCMTSREAGTPFSQWKRCLMSGQ
jgi:hypothetical protein